MITDMKGACYELNYKKLLLDALKEITARISPRILYK